mmetsp:Transcript_11615/g.35487  ORF Transcript_11615/g.35487 Transcript_11615/m.35487 type:complete len:211 (+) Transcript_11615:126-758(+)
MACCFVGGAGYVGTQRLHGAVDHRPRPRRAASRIVNVACVEENGTEASTEPKVNRDIGLHESWYIYYEDGNKCVVCRGKGHEACSYCYGEGYIVIGADSENDRATCPLCSGSAELTCMRCKGSGVRPSTRYNPQTGKVERNPTNAEVLAKARKEKSYTGNQPTAPPSESSGDDAGTARPTEPQQEPAFHDDQHSQSHKAAISEEKANVVN